VGLAASSIPTLLVESENRLSLAHKVARAVADAGVNLNFPVVHRYSVSALLLL
jgi:hypothetical protein